MGQRLGQHFLKNPETLRTIAESLTVDESSTIIEIGPGHGELTIALREAHPKNPIICLEMDYELAPAITEQFKDDASIEIIEGDALESLPKLVKSRFSSKSAKNAGSYAIIGNIPYYISGHLFRIVADLPVLPTELVVLIQKEVAERLQAFPPDMNRLSASIQIWAQPRIVRIVRSGEFTPPPKVDSAVIRLTITPPKWTTIGGKDTYYTTVRALFSQPRKTIANNLSNSFGVPKQDAVSWLTKLDIDPKRRPETLSIAEICSVSKLIAKHKVIPTRN